MRYANICVHFLLYFEDTDLAALAHLESTFAKCRTYSNTLAFFLKNKTALPSKLSTHKLLYMQASNAFVSR